MDVRALDIPDVKLITPKKFGDSRGFFSEVYNGRTFAQVGLTTAFVQDNHSLSAEVGTIRGLHFQRPPHAQTKLIRVVRGAIFDVAVDLRRRSPTFGRHVTAELSAANWAQLYVPAGFAHGFCTLAPDTEVLYKVDAFYAPAHDAGVSWSDPDLGIVWPAVANPPHLSAKDRTLPRLEDAGELF
jgi:dTDP-4-dehydrorhamnose 3,5-epimerase